MITKTDLGTVLGFDYMENFKKLGKCSNIFLGMLIHNFNSESRKWSGVLSNERLAEMRNHSEVIAENDTTIVYRCGNQLYVYKKFNEGIKGKKIS